MKRAIDLSVNLVHSAENASGPLSSLDRDTLQLLELRYKRFLALAHAHPQANLVPTGDIDEMWHLHMLHPRAYFHDCMALFGGVVDHHPDFVHADAATRAQLADCFAATAALWRQAYGEPYMLEHLGADAAAVAGVDAGAAYCAESLAAEACVAAAPLGAAYCAESFARHTVSTAAAYCAKAPARATVGLDAAYCAASSARAPVAQGAAYCALTAAASAPAAGLALVAA